MSSVRVIAGVDGCRGGWVVVSESTDSIRACVVDSIAKLLSALPRDALVAIDIPIGLTNVGARLCDLAARRYLKAPRASSVFPAAIRSALCAETFEDACRINREISGKGISKQAFAIYPKIREIDQALQSVPGLRSRVREVHPEVSFAYWNDGRAMLLGKKSAAGAAERERLIDIVWPGVRKELRDILPRSVVKRDDLNDAFAALWTARRIADNRAITLPQCPAQDAFGFPMEINA